jgi:photosystem II stability/assembly factor-like uncharacterized protein
MAAVLIAEGALLAALATWAVADIVARGRTAIDSENLLAGVTTPSFRFNWGRAGEFVIPLVFLAVLFIWGGVSYLLAARRDEPPRLWWRLVTLAACVAQPVLLLAAVLLNRLAPNRLLFTGSEFSLPLLTLPYYGVYPKAVLGVIVPLALLLAAGSILSLVLYLNRRLPRGNGGLRVTLAAVVAAIVLPWLMTASVNSEYSLRAPRFTPWPQAFWSATLHPSGRFESSGAVACTPAGPCGVVGLGAVTAVGEDGLARAWSTAVQRDGRWALGAIVDASAADPLGGPTSFSCRSAEDCLALIGAVPPLHIPPELFTTSDGGTRWASVALSQAIRNRAVNAVRCTAGHCFLIGATALFESNDAGLTWFASAAAGIPKVGGGGHRGVTSPAFASVDCSSELDCVAVGADGTFALVYSSRDGGLTWTTHRLVDLAGLGGVRCTSATCYAIGPTVVRGTPFPIPARLFETVDNGAAWADLGPIPFKLLVSDLACPETGECIVVGSNINSLQQVALVTHDNGLTWQQGSGVASAQLSLSDIGCSTPSVCVISGSGPNTAVLAETVDAGKEWVLEPFPMIGG